ncbi:hypothetical protein T01_5297 [Trichinella spiralis]|uniref:Uncharacterized protein n=1 Tax=Trichinella spiralis TaxID=6334 RepID=A0A0V1BG84_TRISP|nr:hypothetical protein T01_5297 [Trichinella spiralis]
MHSIFVIIIVLLFLLNNVKYFRLLYSVFFFHLSDLASITRKEDELQRAEDVDLDKYFQNDNKV